MDESKMDENKRIKLHEIGYQILSTCGQCEHARLDTGSDWGTCKINFYYHRKHQANRELSINREGTCPQFEADESRRYYLDGFNEFIPPTKEF